jgi:hypothetical protein
VQLLGGVDPPCGLVCCRHGHRQVLDGLTVEWVAVGEKVCVSTRWEWRCSHTLDTLLAASICKIRESDVPSLLFDKTVASAVGTVGGQRLDQTIIKSWEWLGLQWRNECENDGVVVGVGLKQRGETR